MADELTDDSWESYDNDMFFAILCDIIISSFSEQQHA